ncbi:hypothetical protein CCR75_007445 [Bremia lactucae]|uniref:Uncharacterized protein n=1 Tax=Bremia lactucae TaxID=4779 RepID=A0A976NYK8_BRELC|nr:hypothetical protein CCR75_007445 [Bremia lactucae]
MVSPKTVGGARKKSTRGKSHHSPSHDDVMLYDANNTYASVAVPTSVISSRQLQQLKTSDCEFSFFLQAADKAARQQAKNWDALEGHPVEQVALKYKDAVFRNELPSTPPTRTIDLEAKIQLTDSSPVPRKQFRLSNEQKEAVREWTKKMLAAGIIRPSKSPFSSPTFCV